MGSAKEKTKLLYVEDDAGTRAMLEKLLQHKYPAVTIYTAANGEEGLTLFNEHHPDLIVTDISMPVMNGIEMSTAIRRTGSNAIIIAVSAHNDSDYLQQSADVGISHYIMKPIKFHDLFGAIDSGLASISVQHQQ